MNHQHVDDTWTIVFDEDHWALLRFTAEGLESTPFEPYKIGPLFKALIEHGVDQTDALVGVGMLPTDVADYHIQLEDPDYEKLYADPEGPHSAPAA